MKRKLIALSIAVGCSASVPTLYQTNPDLFHALFSGGEKQQELATKTNFVAARFAEPAQKQLTGRRVQIGMGPRGHFIAEFKINGRKVEAMVDTGATLVAMNRSTARRVGIELSPSDFKYSVSTAKGEAKAAAARIKALQIGRIHVEDIEAVVLDDKSLNSTLIGMSFLKRLGEFRVEGELMLLEQ
jgi:aspartyl protease family protein